MDVSILGVTGGVGGLLARKPRSRSRGDALRELVRWDDQRAEPAEQGVDARLGDLPSMTMEELGETFRGVDAIVFSTGSNGSSKEVTRAIDSDGVTKAIEPARPASTVREPAPSPWGRRSSTARSLARTSPDCCTSVEQAGRSANSTGPTPGRRARYRG